MTADFRTVATPTMIMLALTSSSINNRAQMKRSPLNHSGFVPLLLTILIIVVVLIYVGYTRVLHASH